MGITGTEVAKEAAKMVLLDDNFASIAAAVKEGRCVWSNLRKLMAFVLPTSVAQGFCIAAAIVLGLDQPLTPIQVLYVNMITAVTLGLVLAVEVAEPGIMHKPPRRRSKQLVGKLIAWRCLFVGMAMVVAMLGNAAWTRLLGHSDKAAYTTALNTLIAAQALYCVSCRYTSRSSLTVEAFVTNPLLSAMVLLNAALMCLLTYTPGVQEVFDTGESAVSTSSRRHAPPSSGCGQNVVERASRHRSIAPGSSMYPLSPSHCNCAPASPRSSVISACAPPFRRVH